MHAIVTRYRDRIADQGGASGQTLQHAVCFGKHADTAAAACFGLRQRGSQIRFKRSAQDRQVQPGIRQCQLRFDHATILDRINRAAAPDRMMRSQYIAGRIQEYAAGMGIQPRAWRQFRRGLHYQRQACQRQKEPVHHARLPLATIFRINFFISFFPRSSPPLRIRQG
ncbi:hypothetical protein D3C81_1300670 [compost metagenome]